VSPTRQNQNMITLGLTDAWQDIRSQNVRRRCETRFSADDATTDTTYSEVLSVFKRLVPIPTALDAKAS
jgi:hypothetical protein